jgi:hypothetical protein
MPQLATDNFTRADANPISGPWVTTTAPNVQILSDVASAVGTTVPQLAYNTSATWPANQYSEVTAGTLGNTNWYIGPSVRVDATSQYGYIFLYSQGSHAVFLQKYSTGAPVTLATGTFTILPTDVVRLTIVGNVLWVAQNGNTILTATDAAFATGSAGIGFYSQGALTNTIGLWAGGTPSTAHVGVSDTFARANANPIGGNWSIMPTSGSGILSGTAVEIVSDAAMEVPSNLYTIAYWNGNIFPADQSSEMSFSALSPNGINGPAVRCNYLNNSSAIAGNAYTAHYDSANHQLYLLKWLAGAPSIISGGGPIAQTLTTTDILRIEATGTTLKAKVNGATVLTGTDTDIVYGTPGMQFHGGAANVSASTQYWKGSDFLLPPPTLASCAPVAGSDAGGGHVTLTGANFVATPSVTFGGVAATGIVFINSTTVTCVVPAHAIGAVDIVITNPDANSSTLSAGFLYILPPAGGGGSSLGLGLDGAAATE